MSQTFDDIRYGIRSLFQNPGLSAIAIVCLALGIGANTAIFSVVHALLLGRLPFPEAGRLAMIWQTEELSGNDRSTVAPANYLDWQMQNTVFQDIALFGTVTHNLTGADEPRRLVGARVSAGFFRVLGVTPMLGRTFAPDDDHADAEPTVLLSQALWEEAFDADLTLVGQTIRLSDVPHTVLGVIPQGHGFPTNREYWVPMAFDEEEAAYRDRQYLQSIGRLKPGVSLAAAQSEMDLLADQLTSAYPDTNLNSGIKLVPLREQLVGQFRPVALMLFGAVALVLLIACANVANLLLVKGSSRGRELGIRSALGAGRLRLIRQLMTESLVMALVGGGLGILIAFWGIDLLSLAFESRLSTLLHGGIALNVQVMVFAVGLSLVTGLLFGLLPAFSISRIDLVSSLKDRDHSATSARGPMTLKSSLVVGEIALSMVLLVGAALLTQSLQQLLKSEPGFETSSVLTMRTTLPSPKYDDPARRVAFFRETLQRIRALPEVEQAGAVLTMPFSGSVMGLGLTVEGRPEAPPGEGLGAFYDVVTPGYFEAMRIPLLRGRLFTQADDLEAGNVIIISELMVEEIFHDEDPIGQRITFEDGTTEEEWMTIVGIVGDIMHIELGEEKLPRMYQPHGQSARPSMTIVAQTSRELLSAEPIRGIISDIDPDQPVVNVQMLQDVVASETALPRLTATLTGGFAAAALLLASIGLYGVMSFGVSQRTREIGIRMALGAHRGDIIRQFIRQGLVLTALGIGAGLVSAFWLTKLIASQLFEVTPNDPLTLVVMTLVLAAVATLACYIPARRATKIDPMVALRYE